jgi:hypothetical protein
MEAAGFATFRQTEATIAISRSLPAGLHSYGALSRDKRKIPLLQCKVLALHRDLTDSRAFAPHTKSFDR